MARIGLIISVVLHIYFTIQLAIENRAARGGHYAKRNRVQARISTRTMVWSGAYIACFIVVHLLHFTTQTIHPEYRQLVDAAGRADVYRMMIVGFRNPLMSAFYIVGMLLLCSHLSARDRQPVADLGHADEKGGEPAEQRRSRAGYALAIGFISIPIGGAGGLGEDYVEEAGARVDSAATTIAAASHPRPADMSTVLDSKIPSGPLEKKWEKHKFESKLINPANRRKYEIIVVGSGLAGASAAASLGEMGYKVKCFCYQDSPRRAHSIAAQGGINAAKNYQNDGDSVHRLFYDTIKGGDFRSREANVYRLAEVSVQHHRPVRGAGRALCPRIRRPAGQPQLRRRAGVADFLRPRPDRAAAPARRLLRAEQGRSRRGQCRCFRARRCSIS